MSEVSNGVAFNKIKSLREQLGLAQATVADRIGLSRPSYALVEQGEKELTITQLYRLASELRVNANDLLTTDLEPAGYAGNIDVFKELILQTIRYGGSRTDAKIPKTKLAKMVYFADFAWFYKHGRSISGMRYRRIAQGPVADEFFRVIDELFESQAITIESRPPALMISVTEALPPHYLSEKQIELVKEIGEKWRDKLTSDIVNFTHEQAPWKKSQPGSFIPYEMILQEEETHLF